MKIISLHGNGRYRTDEPYADIGVSVDGVDQIGFGYHRYRPTSKSDGFPITVDEALEIVQALIKAVRKARATAELSD